MDRATAFAHVAEVLAGIAPDVDPAAIRPGLPLREECDIDSMDLLRLLTGIAQRTGVEIAEADYPQVASLDGLLAYLELHGGADRAIVT